jgi:hypothetical protein
MSTLQADRSGSASKSERPAGGWAAMPGQYRANISVRLRHHVALSGRFLAFGPRFFRSFSSLFRGFDSLSRHSVSLAVAPISTFLVQYGSNTSCRRSRRRDPNRASIASTRASVLAWVAWAQAAESWRCWHDQASPRRHPQTNPLAARSQGLRPAYPSSTFSRRQRFQRSRGWPSPVGRVPPWRRSDRRCRVLSRRLLPTRPVTG